MRENGFGTPRVYHITIKNRFISLDGQSEKINRTNLKKNYIRQRFLIILIHMKYNPIKKGQNFWTN